MRRIGSIRNDTSNASETQRKVRCPPLGLFKKIKSGVSTYVRHTDWLLLLLCTTAAAYGCVLIYSTAKTAGLGASDYMIQVAACAAGLIAAIVISKIDYGVICRCWPVLSGVSLILVLLTLLGLGLNAGGPADTAWLGVPIGGGRYVTFQPSELMKITFIISFSYHLSKVREHINELRTVLLLCLHGLVPIGLVFLQGDDGTALVFMCIFAAMMLVAGLRPVYFLVALIGGTALVPFVWNRMTDDKQARFLSLIFVDQYLADEGWQQYLGLTAIGSGRLWGVGFLEGGNIGGYTLYARNNDFIFTVAGEEFGFVGAVALLLLLLGIVLALLRDAMTARDFQGMLLCAGLMAMIGFQSLINLGMNLRILPVIGITLPFFSRGGSSVGTLFLGVGLALSVHYSSRTRIRETIFTKHA